MMKLGSWRIGRARGGEGETTVDPYVEAWAQLSAPEDSWAHGMALTNRSDRPYTREYTVELMPGQCLDMLRRHRRQIASVLGEPVERVLVGESRQGRHPLRGRLTVIKTDPMAAVRYLAAAPTTVDNLIEGVGRLVDGSGEVSVKMWDDDGMVPTVLTGYSGAGKTEAVKVLAGGVLAGGVMNLLYAEPHRYVCGALAKHARVAVLGAENVLRLPALMRALIKRRVDVVEQHGFAALRPSASRPGWMVLHENYPLGLNDHATTAWWDIVGAGARLGLWPVAVTQLASLPEWRAGTSRQVIAFGSRQRYGELFEGLSFEPEDLMRSDVGRFVPGMAVHSGLDTPIRFDYLPNAMGAQRIAERGEPAPPLIDDAAFARWSNVPDVDSAEVEVLEQFLGKAINGRWQVGGPDATHEFKL